MHWTEDYGFDLDDWLFDWDYMPDDVLECTEELEVAA